ncbi:MAG: nitrilase-related carbon-nitrogen hydrolase [Cyclobacteriaceae bacterium]
MTKLRVAGATLNQTPIHWENNLQNIKEAIKMAKAAQVDIVCLPELCITGYGCEDMFLSQWLYETALEKLEIIRQYCADITVAIGLPFKYEGKNYDVSCLISNEEILGFTAKQFLANDGVHYETRWFTPWPAHVQKEVEVNGKTYPFGDIIYEVLGIKVAFEICEDAWRNEERPGYRHAEKGVNLILNTSASHFGFGKSAFREQLVIPYSETFNCTYVFTNALGNEAGRMIYDGEIIIAQQGRLLKKNDRFSMEDVNLLTADVDFEDPSASEMAFPTDSKEKEVEFVKAETLALFDYLRKSHSKGFTVSLSGGADSSTCSVLICEMIRRGVRELGLEKFVHKTRISFLQDHLHKLQGMKEDDVFRFLTGKLLYTAYQATENSSQDTFSAARSLAESIGATFFHWRVDEEIGYYTRKIEDCLGRKLSWEEDDISLQNIQARSRIPGIWMLTNVTGTLLISTNNRSEADVGYATMDGCTSGSIAPIAAVDKYFILKWLRWAEKELNYPGLREVNGLNPTAELRPQEEAQTDESDLMPFVVLVAIERLAIRKWMAPTTIYHKLREEKLEDEQLLKFHIKRFFTLWSRNQWKRERVAPAFHMDDFNVDPRSWCRFPILSGGYHEELAALDKL